MSLALRFRYAHHPWMWKVQLASSHAPEAASQSARALLGFACACPSGVTSLSQGHLVSTLNCPVLCKNTGSYVLGHRTWSALGPLFHQSHRPLKLFISLLPVFEPTVSVISAWSGTHPKSNTPRAFPMGHPPWDISGRKQICGSSDQLLEEVLRGQENCGHFLWSLCSGMGRAATLCTSTYRVYFHVWGWLPLAILGTGVVKACL